MINPIAGGREGSCGPKSVIPFGDLVPSTLVACLPILTQLGLIASTATNWFGHERFVFEHSIILACLVGGLVTLQAYCFFPFTKIVID